MFATALNMLGVCEQALGNHEACVSTTDRILRHTNQMDASEEAEWRMNRATCLSSLDRGEEALLEYDLALALLEQDEGHSEITQARLHLLRGSGRFNTGDVLGAARDSYTALKFYEDSKFEDWSPQDLYNVGVIHFNLGLIFDELSVLDASYQSYHIGLVIMTLSKWPDDGTLAKCRAKYIHHAEMNGDDEKRRMVEAGQCRSLGRDLMEWVEMALSHSRVLEAFSEG